MPRVRVRQGVLGGRGGGRARGLWGEGRPGRARRWVLRQDEGIWDGTAAKAGTAGMRRERVQVPVTLFVQAVRCLQPYKWLQCCACSHSHPPPHCAKPPAAHYLQQQPVVARFVPASQGGRAHTHTHTGGPGAGQGGSFSAAVTPSRSSTAGRKRPKEQGANGRFAALGPCLAHAALSKMPRPGAAEPPAGRPAPQPCQATQGASQAPSPPPAPAPPHRSGSSAPAQPQSRHRRARW